MTLSPDFIFSMASKLTALALPKNSPATKHDGLTPALLAALLNPLFIPPVKTATLAIVV